MQLAPAGDTVPAMGWGNRVCASGVAAFLVLLLSAPASAPANGLKPITGHLSQPGYTVIALAANGEARSVVAQDGQFSLRPPAETVTLHLRAPDGIYAGPVVLKEKGDKVKQARAQFAKAEKKVKKAKRNVKKARSKQTTRKATKQLKKAKAQLKEAKRRLRSAQKQRAAKPNWAILGVKAGARLGAVEVNAAAGYGFVRGLTERVWTKWVDNTLKAHAKNGVPIGAGNFGRVWVPKLTGPSSDRDLDGIPTSLDVDDDGDLVLDDVDRQSTASASAGATSGVEAQPLLGSSLANAFLMFAGLQLGFESPFDYGNASLISPIVNANAPGLTEQQIEAALPAKGTLWMGIGKTGNPFVSAELDCGQLVYCSAGGTGKYEGEGYNAGVLDLNPPSFPECCDTDGDGQGSFDANFGGQGNLGLLLQTGANADQIRAGDLLMIRATTASGEQQEFAATLQTIPATVPALASYTDELGTEHVISYPIAPGTTFPVMDGPDPGSDVSVKLTFWRPQRRPIPGEVAAGAGKWIDIGGLQYFAQANLDHPPNGEVATSCPQSSYSEVQQGLTPSEAFFPGDPSTFLFIDSAVDRRANPNDTFSYTLNLSQCRVFRGLTFSPGEAKDFIFRAALPASPGQPVTNSAASIYSFENRTGLPPG